MYNILLKQYLAYNEMVYVCGMGGGKWTRKSVQHFCVMNNILCVRVITKNG